MSSQDYNSISIPVPDEFPEVFTHFYSAVNNTDAPINKTLYPAYHTIMVFHFGQKPAMLTNGTAQTAMDKCFILGPIKQAFDYTLPAGSEILVANFKDDAFYRFFGNITFPEHLPFNPDVLLDEDCFTQLWHELKEIKDTDSKITCILDFCRPYLKDREANFLSISHFHNGNDLRNPVKVIADATHRSERSVQMDYKKFFRYSAKEINRYQRFVKATELIQNDLINSVEPDWFTIIGQCGYYDQSQLIHDFKHFIGLTPKQYLKFHSAICQPKSE